MTAAPDRHGGAGASARRIADAERAAERSDQHRKAKALLPLSAGGAAVIGWAVAEASTWEAGAATAAAALAYGAWRVYRRGANSWATGAAGEERTARMLAPLARRGYLVLHDRAVPGSRANLDHLVAGPAGVVYVDTKAWRSKHARVTVTGGVLRYGRYDKTREVQTARWEAERAAAALGVPVRPVIAVHGARVPAPRGRLELHGVTVIEARRLRSLIESLPPQQGWDATRIDAVGQRAQQRLPAR